ncbi:hypothetical protein [Spiroplasma sp. SV19]|uniref:hypothetical protein n=1 Tax=Spiroplasma sp. SV19 TaxID=2570468 RepID=UPI0024B7E035|nr:hypothetical protein [Spiroplasma sp. SV19]WHQ37086.1 hypothetical protein E7Y35_04210 [Spiroplasma sp. SV19]
MKEKKMQKITCKCIYKNKIRWFCLECNNNRMKKQKILDDKKILICKEHCFSCHLDGWKNCVCGYEHSQGCKYHSTIYWIYRIKECKLMTVNNKKKNIQLTLFK